MDVISNPQLCILRVLVQHQLRLAPPGNTFEMCALVPLRSDDIPVSKSVSSLTPVIEHDLNSKSRLFN